MANLTIQGIGQKIFNPPKTVAKSSNPFSATSFKGNVLTADVFESVNKSKHKLTYSAFVGSIADAFPTFRKAAESVVAFGNRIKHGVSAIANKINDIGSMEISIDIKGMGNAIKSGIESVVDGYSVSKLKKYDVATLENMWKSMSELNVAV